MYITDLWGNFISYFMKFCKGINISKRWFICLHRSELLGFYSPRWGKKCWRQKKTMKERNKRTNKEQCISFKLSSLRRIIWTYTNLPESILNWRYADFHFYWSFVADWLRLLTSNYLCLTAVGSSRDKDFEFIHVRELSS
jgi:hypothetical protein